MREPDKVDITQSRDHLLFSLRCFRLVNRLITVSVCVRMCVLHSRQFSTGAPDKGFLLYHLANQRGVKDHELHMSSGIGLVFKGGRALHLPPVSPFVAFDE